MCESGLYGSTQVGAAIVGTADLRHPEIESILRAHMRSRNFVGIRMQRRQARMKRHILSGQSRGLLMLGCRVDFQPRHCSDNHVSCLELNLEKTQVLS